MTSQLQTFRWGVWTAVFWGPLKVKVASHLNEKPWVTFLLCSLKWVVKKIRFQRNSLLRQTRYRKIGIHQHGAITWMEDCFRETMKHSVAVSNTNNYNNTINNQSTESNKMKWKTKKLKWYEIWWIKYELVLNYSK